MRNNKSTDRMTEFEGEKFETDGILIYNEGIQIKKNYITIKSIDYSKISCINVYQGYLIKRRGISILIGLGAIIAPIVWFTKSVYFLIPWRDLPLTDKGFWLILASPWFVFTIGVYLLVMGFTKSTKLMIRYISGEEESIEIKRLEKDGRLERLVDFLKPKVKITQYNTRSLHMA